jgi:hypothetical protein
MTFLLFLVPLFISLTIGIIFALSSKENKSKKFFMGFLISLGGQIFLVVLTGALFFLVASLLCSKMNL